jgi:uncharacterized protein (TIGR00725 family)
MQTLIAVIGAGECSPEIYNLAKEAGIALAEQKYSIICGGLGGVMQGVCEGAKSKGGLTIGILPGDTPSQANAFIDIPITTGMGIGRNIIIVRSAAAILAIDGAYGTLSEIAYALQLKKTVIGLKTWDISNEIIIANSVPDMLLKLRKTLY